MNRASTLIFSTLALGVLPALAYTNDRSTQDQQGQDKLRAFEMGGERQSAGLFFWDGKQSPGSVFLQYGQPNWGKACDEAVAANKAVSMRLGKNAWTSMDTNLALEIGGKKIPAGYYYLGLHKDAESNWGLSVFSADEIRKKRIASYQTAKLKPEILVPLKLTEAEEHQKALKLHIQPVQGDKAKFEIRWGKHQLTADVKVMLPGVADAAARKGLDKLKKLERLRDGK